MNSLRGYLVIQVFLKNCSQFLLCGVWLGVAVEEVSDANYGEWAAINLECIKGESLLQNTKAHCFSNDLKKGISKLIGVNDIAVEISLEARA